MNARIFFFRYAAPTLFTWALVFAIKHFVLGHAFEWWWLPANIAIMLIFFKAEQLANRGQKRLSFVLVIAASVGMGLFMGIP